jgi:hypothetical protein
MTFLEATIYTLAGLRTGVGISCLLAPATVLRLCQLAAPSSAALSLRLGGVRDIVIGGLLWTADGKSALRRALIAGAVVDAMDVLCIAWGMWEGELQPGWAALLLGGGAGALCLIGLAGLKAIGRD